METVALGRTGMQVSRLCLGTANFGKWGRTDQADCDRLVGAALDSGINIFDTADAYADGEAESLLGNAVKSRRDEAIVATKFFYPMGPGVNDRGGSRRWIVRAVDESLRRLGTDWIDLYQMHCPDPHTDIDQTLGALSDLVRAGKIRAFGSSAFTAEDLLAARHTALSRGREFFLTEQAPYSIFVREIEKHVLPTCGALGLGVLSWGVVNSGWLAGRYRRGQDVDGESRAAKWPVSRDRFDFDRAEADRKLDLVEELAAVADQAGISLTQLSIGFVLEHPVMTTAVIGPRTAEQLTDLIAAADTRLPVEVLDEIDRIVPPGTNVDAADLHNYKLPGLDVANRRRSR